MKGSERERNVRVVVFSWYLEQCEMRALASLEKWLLREREREGGRKREMNIKVRKNLQQT